MNSRLKTALSVIVFVMAAALSYLAVTHWPKAVEQATKPNSSDTIAGVDGLAEGDVIVFPQMQTLKGERAALDKVTSEKFLLVLLRAVM